MLSIASFLPQANVEYQKSTKLQAPSPLLCALDNSIACRSSKQNFLDPKAFFELLDVCQACELLGMRRIPPPGRNLNIVFQLYFHTGPIFNGGGATITLIYISLFRLYRLCDVEGLLMSYPTLYIFFCYTSSWSLTHILLISLT